VVLFACSGIKAFDWNFTELNRSDKHIIVPGAHSKPIENTNFDWNYYIAKNHIQGIYTEHAAYEHYMKIGKVRGYQCCKKFKILILLHLYNLDLIDELIGQINFFIKNNPVNSYYIKIVIPIDGRLLKCSSFRTIPENDVTEYIRSKTPYHQQLITPEYAHVLFNIEQYLKKNLQIDIKHIQIIFSENRGVDIGSFFLMLDQVKKENLSFDYMVKIHSKTNLNWRKLLLSSLNLKINKLLRLYDCIYTFKVIKTPDPLLIDIKNRLNIPDFSSCEYSFCGGTMFIAPYAFYEYIQSWDFVSLFNMLHMGRVAEDSYEHAFERLFGYIFTLLNFKILCHDYYNAQVQVKYRE
jgi:hypothetical protein